MLSTTQLYKFSLVSTPANLIPNAHEWVSKSFRVLCPREVNHSYPSGETKAIICIFATGTLLVSAGHLPVLSWGGEGESPAFSFLRSGSFPAGLVHGYSTALLNSFCDFSRASLGDEEPLWVCRVPCVFQGHLSTRLHQLVRVMSGSQTVFFSCLLLVTCAQFIARF